MNKKTYVCLGICQAVISQDEYEKGLTACGNDQCQFKAHPFVEGAKCSYCGKNYALSAPHQHKQ